MKEASEQEIQKTIIDYLRIKQYVVFKHHSTGSTIRGGKPVFFAYGEKGISDIIACSTDGRFVAIEVKKKGGKPSQEQLEFLARVKDKRGIAILAYSLQDVLDVFENPTGTLVALLA
jgi:hypothetical protein